MSVPVTLRAAQPTDAGSVGGILSEFIDDTPWMPRVHTRAEDLSFAGDMIARGWVTVACAGRAVQGFVARDGEHIHALYVAGVHRGRGVGAALLRRMQAEVASLSLWTFVENDRAQAFYAAHGFQCVAQTDGAGNDEGLPDLRFVWRREGSA